MDTLKRGSVRVGDSIVTVFTVYTVQYKFRTNFSHNKSPHYLTHIYISLVERAETGEFESGEYCRGSVIGD